MAQGYFNNKAKEKGLKVISKSAGISVMEGEKASPTAIKIMKQLYGIDISSHKAKAVTEMDLEESELVLTMTRMQKAILISNFPEHREKIFMLSEYVQDDESCIITPDVKDPYMGDQTTYTEVLNEISFYVDKIISTINQDFRHTL